MKYKRILGMFTVFALLFCAACSGEQGAEPADGTASEDDTGYFSPAPWQTDGTDAPYIPESVYTSAQSVPAHPSGNPGNSGSSSGGYSTDPTTPTYSSGNSGSSYSAAQSNPTNPTTAPTSPTSATVSQGSTARETVTVMITPGQNFFDVRSSLERAGVCSATAFTEVARTYKVNSFTVPESSDRYFKMEGYLFPDTYEFYKNDDPQRVLVTILNNYRQKSGLPTSTQLIVASIVEREARSYENMQKVASVLYNRVADGSMPMQVEPARSYANALIADSGNAVGSPKAESIAILYGTMRPQSNGKLPAGPICNPSATAIRAAMNPAQSDYMYFFFGQDGLVHYSVTFDEHTAKINDIGVQFN